MDKSLWVWFRGLLLMLGGFHTSWKKKRKRSLMKLILIFWIIKVEPQQKHPAKKNVVRVHTSRRVGWWFYNMSIRRLLTAHNLKGELDLRGLFIRNPFLCGFSLSLCNRLQSWGVSAKFKRINALFHQIKISETKSLCLIWTWSGSMNNWPL